MVESLRYLDARMPNETTRAIVPDDTLPKSSRLPPSVIAAGWVSFLTDVATEMVYPLLPAFLESLQAGRAMLGLIEGVAETTAALLRLPAGVISDWLGRRKPLMLLGYGLAGLVRPLLGIVTAAWQVLLVRFADRVGKGIRGAPRDALIADVTAPQQRGRAFGFHRAMDHAGAAVGPLLAFAFLYFWPGEYRTLFLLTLVPGLAVIVVLWLFVQEPPLATSLNAGDRRPNTLRLSTSVLQGPFIWLLAAILLFTLSRATELLLLSRAQQLGVAAVYLPLLWCGYHVAKSYLSVVGGKLGDRFDARLPLMVGWGIHALVYVGFAMAETAGQAVALFLVYAVHFGFSEPAEKILVARWSAAEQRGTAFGWYHLAVGIAALPASAVFGLLWDWSDYGAVLPFSLSAAVAAAAIGVVALTFRVTSR